MQLYLLFLITKFNLKWEELNITPQNLPFFDELSFRGCSTLNDLICHSYYKHLQNSDKRSRNENLCVVYCTRKTLYLDNSRTKFEIA